MKRGKKKGLKGIFEELETEEENEYKIKRS